jgi:GntR family transcriptional regulator
MYIDKTSPIPVYYQLKKLITAKIAAGEFAPNLPIPSERELGETLKISRMTVRQALNQLVNEGVLYREKGKGTFVSKPKIEQHNIMSFSEIVKSKGMRPATKVLLFKKELPIPEVSELLDLQPHDPVYQISRLRLADDTPIGIETVFIPEKFCPDLERLELTASLYRLIGETYSWSISYVDNEIESSLPSPEEQKLLTLVTGIPVIRIKGQSFTESGIKLFYERSVYRADEYKFCARIYVNES